MEMDARAFARKAIDGDTGRRPMNYEDDSVFKTGEQYLIFVHIFL